ncbi:FecR family protein [bacterium]|nr:FecR family protein [bacterium]
MSMAPNKYTWILLLGLILIAMLASPAYSKVGEIGQIKGSGVLEREGDIVIDGNAGVGVLSMDEAVTANGTMRIDFVDETRVELTEQSRLVIDEFVYDPANDIGSLSMKASLGTVRYASGQIAKKYKQNVKIRTPSATIGVRGTDFVMVVDEMGGSMITLLPSCDTAGMCYVGEIEVMTDAGFVVLNQAFQATATVHGMRKPTTPVILDINEDMINNLLILRKRMPIDEYAEEEMQRRRKLADFLGVDFLEFDGLDGDALKDSIEGIWKTALDETDYMLADMLHDMLDKLNEALAALFKDELQRQNERLLSNVPQVGFDPNTQIRLDLIEPYWIWQREDFEQGGFIRLRLNNQYDYTLDVQQGEFYLYDYRLGSEGNNSITIIQTNN